ncbi:MAG: hypothetical protein V4494_02780 [Chlamydiota bacterium]
MSQHPALSQDQLSATDLFFTIKDRVIDIRVTSDRIIKFRARFRKKGHPPQIQVFPELKLAKHWLDEQNRNALLNIHMPNLIAKKTTLSEVVDLYINLSFGFKRLPIQPQSLLNSYEVF